MMALIEANALLQFAVFVALLMLLAWPLGEAIAKLWSEDPPTHALVRAVHTIEAAILRVLRIRATDSMSWQHYALAVLAFNSFGMLLVYAIQRLQNMLPMNELGYIGVLPEVAFNTAVSFVTNTNWQSYAGEATMSHLTQMTALTVQNFLSAATGLAVLVALVRGFSRQRQAGIGNFWSDVVRATIGVLLPLSLVVAVLLASQGVVQSFAAQTTVHLLDVDASTTQTLALGPVASQVAIKQLGTNGGGFMNANAAHPFENPTPLSNLLQLITLLLLPAALCFAFGAWVRDRRQGRALLWTMWLLFVPLLLACLVAEQNGNPAWSLADVDQRASADAPGGNMEGKDVRFGITNSVLWAVATTAASNGSVNAMHDSLTPLGGLVPLWLMQLGEIVFGGVGSGLYGMIIYAILAVFIAGLMIGRTPEYLGKKIEAYEVKMAALVLIVPAAATLIAVAIACALPEGRAATSNPAAHGYTEILYAFSSAANNNGSAFGGLNGATPFFAVALALCMWVGRFFVMVPVLAIAGSLAAKKRVPQGSGTLPTHTPLFVVLLIGTIVLVGALTYLPALTLGPVVEHLTMTR